MMRSQLVLVATFGAAFVLASPRADACGAPCPDPQVAFESQSILPSNLPALAIVGTENVPFPDGGVSLEELDGGGVPVSITGTQDGVIVEPVTALPEGASFRMEWDSSSGCSVEDVRSVSFTTGPAAPLPASMGEVTTGELQLGELNLNSGASCTTQVVAASRAITITPSAELVPFLPSTRWVLEVDGEVWARETFGAVSADGAYRPDPLWHGYGYATLERVFTRCDEADAGSVTIEGLAPGTHSATLTAVIAGSSAPVLPPVNFSFELSCPDSHDVTPEPSVARGCSSTGAPSAAPFILAALAFLAIWATKKTASH